MRRRLPWAAIGAVLLTCICVPGIGVGVPYALLVVLHGPVAEAPPVQKELPERQPDPWPEQGIVLAAADVEAFRVRRAAEQAFAPQLLKARREPGHLGPVLLEHATWPVAVAFAGAAPMLAVADDRETRLWDLQTGKLLHRLPGTGDSQGTVALSPDGALVAVSCGDGTIAVWTTADGQLAKVLHPGGRPWALVFNAGGRRLVGLMGVARSWDVKTWESHDLPDVEGSSVGGPLRPDGRYRIAERIGNGFTAYDLEHGGRIRIPIREAPWGLALSHDGRRFAVSSPPRDGKSRLAIYDLLTGKTTSVGLLDGHLLRLQFMPDDARLLCFFKRLDEPGSNAEFRLIDVATRQQFWKSPGSDRAYAVSPGGELIAISTHAGVELWAVSEFGPPR